MITFDRHCFIGPIPLPRDSSMGVAAPALSLILALSAGTPRWGVLSFKIGVLPYLFAWMRLCLCLPTIIILRSLKESYFFVIFISFCSKQLLKLWEIPKQNYRLVIFQLFPSNREIIDSHKFCVCGHKSLPAIVKILENTAVHKLYYSFTQLLSGWLKCRNTFWQPRPN